MRHAASEALPNGEFGTGLRARLDLARARERETEHVGRVLELRQKPRRNESPELALVDPDVSIGDLQLNSAATRDEPLGQLLTEAGLLGDKEIEPALKHARASGKRLGEVLVELGLVEADEIVRLVAAQRGLPFVDVRKIRVDPAAARLLPAELARDNRALPVGFARGLPVVAVADPTDETAMQGACSVLGSARFVASPEDSILYQLGRVYARTGVLGAQPPLPPPPASTL